MTAMRFGVLGPVAVWTSGGDPVAVPGLKVRALLADLLVHEGRPVPADRLIDDLWGEDLPSNPAGALSAKVSQLRRALEDAEPGARDLVVSGPAGYALRTEQVDAVEFRAFLARAEEDPATILAEAEALWRGPAFADFADEAFTQPAITRLTEQRLTAQEDRAEARLALGEHTRLADELGDLVAEHPLRERLRAAHMRALYRAGRQSEALACFDRLRTLLADELGLDPSAELVELHQAMLTQDPSLDAAKRPARPASNLPAQRTELIGRDDAVAEVSARLGEGEDRLVTLTGPGGVGKTRLALAVAAGLLVDFPDGVRLVELAAVEPPGALDARDALIDVVLTALDVREAPGETVTATERLTAALQPRRVLLVLDNCEHLIDQVAELADLVLAAAPGLRVLATSREALAIEGEVVWNVPPLDLPDGTELAGMEESGAVRLFVARAAAADRGFRLDAETAPAVSVLCRRLDGIPFALELAANRVRALGVQGLVARLDDRFRLLATGHRGAPPRQQTLTAMIDWSWDLLSEPERTVLSRLAIHTDGCTADAAEAVCSDQVLPGAEVLDLLARLVDRSLVVPVHTGDGPRYRLLESVAAYCLDRLHEQGQFDGARQAHHRYYLELAERAEAFLYGPDQQTWLRRLDAEAGNLRSALDGAVADGRADQALRLVSALAWYWFLRGRFIEARRSLDAARALNGEAPAALRARVAAWQAGFAFLQGDGDWIERRDKVLKLYDDDGGDDAAGRARSEWFLAFVGTDAGDLTVGARLLDRALATFEELGDQWGAAAVHLTRAKHAHVRADVAALGQDAQCAAKLFGEVGDRWGQLLATEWLAAQAELNGDHDQAAAQHRDGLRIAEELGLWIEVAGRLGWLGWIALQQGDYQRAREYAEQSLRLATEQGDRSGQVLGEIVLGFAARKLGDLEVAEAHLRSLAEQASDGALYLGMVLVELGFATELRGDAAAARALHERAFEAARQLESVRGLAFALEGLAGAVSLAGSNDQAARLLGSAATARESAEVPLSPAESGDVERISARVREALGSAGFDAAFSAGAGLTPEEARAEVSC